MLPPIGMKGVFTFKTPFDTLEYKTVLEVISIRSFKELSSANIDIEKFIYSKEGLTSADYKRDLENNEHIIIFADNSNNQYRIPTSYIINTPITNGETFKNVYLSFPLGYIPADYKLDVLVKEVSDLLLKNLGIKTTPKIINSGRDQVYDKTKVAEFDARVTANRNNRQYVPFEEKIKELEQQLQVARKTNEDLQTFMSNRYQDIVIPDPRPNAEDLKLYTKKIKIEVKSKDALTQGILKGFSFLIYNSYNLDPTTIYLTRSSKYENDDNTYACVLNNVKGVMKLTKGEYNNTTSLPRMFSRSDFTKFVSQLSTIELEFEKPLNIRGYSFTPHDGNTLFSSMWQVTLYNKDDSVISVIKNSVVEDAELSVEKKDLTLRVSVVPENPLS